MPPVQSISDLVSHVQQIQSQLRQLQSGAMLDSLLGVTKSSETGAPGSAEAGAGAGFAGALAAAQGVGEAAGQEAGGPVVDQLDPSSLETAYDPTLGSSDGGGVGIAAGVALPPRAATLLTSDQRQFASVLSARTGLNPGVVCAWLLAEESGGAAQSRQATDNNDWLNIGYTGSGTFGAGDSIWSDPNSAAQATAQWLRGQDSIPGYGTASSGIQAILGTVGQTPSAQISALQTSGWAGSGYTNLGEVYAEVTGAAE
jgi:hypothetical protein